MWVRVRGVWEGGGGERGVGGGGGGERERCGREGGGGGGLHEKYLGALLQCLVVSILTLTCTPKLHCLSVCFSLCHVVAEIQAKDLMNSVCSRAG